MVQNNLRQRINNKECVIGTFVKVNNPDVIEIIGKAGFDFVIIDTEHANFSNLDVANLIRTADSVNLNSIVRVSTPSEDPILHALDSGADGVQIPNVKTIEQAKMAAQAAKYYPLGTRGLSLTQRAANYGVWNKDVPYTTYSNENTLVSMHVENIEIANHIEELCDIEQIDVIFVGPADLSQSMGLPGQMTHPDVVKVIENVFKVAIEKGKAVGIFCGNPDAVKKYVDLGAKYILYSSDTTLIYKGFKSAFDAADEKRK